jgi:hypothetical protein
MLRYSSDRAGLEVLRPTGAPVVDYGAPPRGRAREVEVGLVGGDDGGEQKEEGKGEVREGRGKVGNKGRR